MGIDSGILKKIELENIGPTDKTEISFAPRLNIITGDNGIGKTFLMNCSWKALTDTWTYNSAFPKYKTDEKESSIGYVIKAKENSLFTGKIIYDAKTSSWKRRGADKGIAGTVIYSLVDNCYAIWDSNAKTEKADILSSRQAWDGDGKFTEGLIADWLKWQKKPQKYPFGVFKDVLKAVSPPDMGELCPGEPVLDADGVLMPTIEFPYATVPITYSSAGIRRIVTLAYLIVKTWDRHIALCRENGTSPDTGMVVMIDEIEAHIHPKWQRTILSALMKIQNSLSENACVQFIISTHSPLVLASAEAVFDDDEDKLFKVKLSDDRKNAVVREEDFIKYGQINAWLTSPIFDLTQARSIEAEKAVEEAKRLQLEDDPNPLEVQKAHENLLKYLSQTDPFWPRWIYFAQNNGADV